MKTAITMATLTVLTGSILLGIWFVAEANDRTPNQQELNSYIHLEQLDKPTGVTAPSEFN